MAMDAVPVRNEFAENLNFPSRIKSSDSLVDALDAMSEVSRNNKLKSEAALSKSWRTVLSWPVLGTAWIVLCLLYIQTQVGWSTLASMLPHEIATAVLGVVVPLVFIWIVTNNKRRADDFAAIEARLTEKLASLGAHTNPLDATTHEAGEALRRRAVDLASTAEIVAQRLDKATAALGDQLADSVNLVIDATQRSEDTRQSGNHHGRDRPSRRDHRDPCRNGGTCCRA